MAVVVISDPDDFVTPSEITAAVAETGKCIHEDNKTRVLLHRTQQDMGSIWLKYLAAEEKIATYSSLKVGWISSKARVDILSHCCGTAE